ncbi:MAG: serine/threonine-protein kinase [Myxococcota bacterium]
MFGVDASPVKIGRFTVLETVGSGGMGVVYAAYDEELDRRVAVKLLRSSREEDASVGKGRLQREAQALAKLSHPNVVQVYEVGTFDERVFLAMEFLEGPNFRTWLLDEPRSWREVLHHFVKAGEGLAAAHREGIIHRDFKPANVLFGSDGRVRVVDFGLARASEHARVPQVSPSGEFKERAFAIELTQTGEIMGTPAYMSPEQARYEGVDARSDQYSFCVALYEAMFGRRPHEGSSTAEVLIAVSRGEVIPPPRNSKVPARVIRAIMRGLSVDPSERFPTMEALLVELSLQDRTRWRWLGAGAVALTGLGLYASTALVAEPRCQSFEAELAGQWGPEQAAAIEEAFVDSGAAQARNVAAHVNARLSDYASEWLDARRDTCEAYSVRHEQSARIHDQRFACLLERKVELATIVSVFASADQAMVEQAPRGVAELSSLDDCSDFQRMRAAAEAVESNELRARLAEVRAQYKAGLYDQALAGADSVVEAARVQGAPRIEAQARLQQALVQEQRRTYQRAAEMAEDAIDLAEAAKDDSVAARAWSRFARYQAQLNQTKLADLSARRAMAKVRRLGDRSTLLLEARESQALTAWRAQRYDEAIDDQIAVVRHYNEQHGGDDPRTADAERRLANMLSDVGRHEEAQVRYERARQVLARAYGPDHPMVAHVMVDAAIDFRAANELEDARKGFLEAERVFVAAQGSMAPALLSIHKSLGAIALVEGDLEEAKFRTEQSSALLDEPGVSAIDRPDVLGLKAKVAERRGEYEDMVEAYRQYLAMTQSDNLVELYRSERIIARVNVSVGLRQLGQHSRVEAELRQAMAELDEVSDDQADPGTKAKLRGNIWLLLGDCKKSRSDRIDAYRQGLDGWPENIQTDEEAHLVRAKLRLALAEQLRPTEPERAEDLAQGARSSLNEASRAELDDWLSGRAF